MRRHDDSVATGIDPASVAEAPTSRADGWRARLALGFARRGEATRLAHRAHDGPLLVQKALYPEGESVCQCIIVHPPGGIAGGDRLALDVDVGAGARAQLTTPGATKWYRAAGRDATQDVRMRIARDGVLEWLPQGNIAFDGACARSRLDVRLDAGASFIGWDACCLGRIASGERFTRGEWRQRFEISRGDALIWSERAVLAADSALLASPLGLYGAPIFGTFVAVSAGIDQEWVTRLRACAVTRGEGAVTSLPGVVVGRYRGDSLEAAHAWFSALWHVARPAILGRAAVPPRIWST